MLSVAAHWARLSRLNGDATADWYGPKEASAVTTDASEAIFLKLNHISSDCKASERGRSEGGVRS